MKTYCGNQKILPEGYDRFGTNYECLKKGYGICKYNGKQYSKNTEPSRKKREKTYCGNDLLLPLGYDRYATLYECLKKGYGICLNGSQKKSNLKK